MSPTTCIDSNTLPVAVQQTTQQHELTVINSETLRCGRHKDVEYTLETKTGLRFKATARQLKVLTTREALALFAMENHIEAVRPDSRQFRRIQALATGAGAKLIDPVWHGADYYYTFLLKDGRHVQIRGGKLLERGWPTDIDTYLSWSAARKLRNERRKSATELFDEFKSMVASHGATVTETSWQGARTPHAVLLSDGTTRYIKPNQLKYIGWPMVPYDELRKLAEPAAVSVLPASGEGAEQQFLLTLPGGWYKQGGFYELKALIEDKMVEQALEAKEWASRERLTILPQEWVGPEAEYSFLHHKGAQFLRQLPCAARIQQARDDKLNLGYIRRAGNRLGYTLLTEEWRGKSAAYRWTAPDGSEVFSTVQGLELAITQENALAKLRAKGEALNHTLLSTVWLGDSAAYSWRNADGQELTLTLTELKDHVRRQKKIGKREAARNVHVASGQAAEWVRELKCWAESVGLGLENTKWRGATASYMWRLPNGRLLVAPVHKLKAFVNKMLKERKKNVLTARDSARLLEEFPHS